MRQSFYRSAFRRANIIIAVVAFVATAIVLLTVYILFFRDTVSNSYYIVSDTYSDNQHVQVICDGEYLYDYNCDTTQLYNKRLAKYVDTIPALYIVNSDVDKSIVKVGDLDVTYTCTLEAVSWYVRLLEEKGYSAVSYTLDSNHIDLTLVKRGDTIRVVWRTDETCYIFRQDSGKNNEEPPYING